jgi:phosphoribosylformylglycinamidine synthase
MAKTVKVVTVKPQALIITGFGINCDRETAWAFEAAGANADRVHLNDLIADPSLFDQYQIMAVPGGFSFGDDIASGRILANRLRYKLGDALHAFVDNGNLVIGICNGFQVLVKMGILPLFDGEFRQDVTLTHNDSARFEDRWTHLRKDPDTPCVWLKDIDQIELPIRHGEGKFIPRDDGVLARLRHKGQIALRYATSEGEPAQGRYPTNPNGSTDDIAAICDPTGHIFGLMPHPEAYLHNTNHPQWTRQNLPTEGAGLKLFQNAVEHTNTELLAETH